MSELVRYDAMCRAIDAAYEIDEVKAIHDHAAMLQAAARVAKNVEAETRAYEIRMRAAKKANKIYDAGPKPKASPGNQYTGKVDRPDKAAGPKTLNELGISSQEMSEWRKLNSISDEQFEVGLATKTLPDLLSKPSPVDGEALLLYGMMHDFERRWLKQSPEVFMSTMTETMIEDVVRIAPRAAEWLSTIKESIDG